MTSAALYLIPFALLAAASPLGLAATLTVLHAGRVRALGLAGGVLAGQLLTCALLVLIGRASVSHRTTRPGVEAVLELCLGVALLVLAFVLRRRPERTESSGSRSHKILERLEHVHGTTVLFAGLLLGIGGPKRLVLTGIASASITAAGVDSGNEAVLVLWYSALATVVVWAPVLAAIVLGQRALDVLDAGFRWLGRHQRPVTVSVLLVVGAFLVVHGAVVAVTQA